VLQQSLRIIDNGWPNDITIAPHEVYEHWNVWNDIHTAENLLPMGDRLILLAEGHLGIKKCKARARLCVCWPYINDDSKILFNMQQIWK